MIGADFLRLVWPAQGPYLLAMPAEFMKAGKLVKYHKHSVFTNVDDAYTTAVAAADEGENVFFALGAIKEIPTTKGLSGIRKKENIRGVRAFWLDLDVKPDDKAYPTQKAALDATYKFVDDLDLPEPYVVSSGAGLHVYWPLTEELDSDKWAHYAELFKSITVAHGLKADPSRTADRASILRVPDTINHKPGRAVLPVNVLEEGDVTDTNEFLKKIAFIASTSNLQAAPARNKPAINVAKAVAMNEEAANTYTPADVKKVLTRCAHLNWQFRNPTQVSQGQWYAALGVLRYCISGEKACHKFSQLDPSRYSADDVDRKLAQLEAGGYKPTTCAKFEAEGATECATCRWKGKVGSPITVATMAEEAAAPVMVALVEGDKVEVALPDPPAPYRRIMDPNGQHARISIITEVMVDGVAQEFEDKVYEYDMYPYGILYDETEGGYVARMKHWLPMEGWRDVTIPFAALYDKRKVLSAFGHNGVVIAGSDNAERLECYVRAYIAQLQKTTAAQYLYTQLGWKDNGSFVLPGTVLNANGDSPCSISDNIREACNGWAEPSGSLEEWVRLAGLYNKPECIPHQIGILSGFAAPLMKFSGFAGAMIVLVGDPGCGKTTAAEGANAIFGHPRMGDVNDSTGNALYARLGVLQNLLCTYDEITKLDAEQISDMAYSVTRGHGKARLDRNAQLKERLNWITLMLATSNRSLHEILAMLRSNTTAESVRIVELHTPPGTLDKHVADDQKHGFYSNFGWAGPIFIRAVMQMGATTVSDRIRHWGRTFDTAAGVSGSERYWSAVASLILFACEVANRLGLVAYDIQAIFDEFVRCVRLMRATVVDNAGTPVGVLADYFNASLNSTLIVKPLTGGTGYSISLQPHAAMRVRVDEGLNKAFIDRVHFREFCARKGVEYNQTKLELRGTGVIVDDDHKIVLGKGTHLKSAQTRCLVVDLAHPSMTGVAGFVASSAPATGNVVQLPGQKVV